jgi:glycosyltransferase involved in cell wall biosynthesis
MTSVILNGYKRLDFLNQQIQSIKKQTYPINEILVWQNSTEDKNASLIELDKDVIHINSSHNFGVWARFAAALNCKSEYICVFDDDTIPGENWIKNCIETIEKKNGLIGTRGVRFASKEEYLVGEEFGWNNPNNEIKEVDIVGHSWFFRRDWLSYFWRELPKTNSSFYVGEDIHFSYILQKYLKLNTYVPPHPHNDKSLWGSDYNSAMKIGTDSNAISFNDLRKKEMDSSLKYYISKGFELKYVDQLKYKKIFLKTKKEIKKLFE